MITQSLFKPLCCYGYRPPFKADTPPSPCYGYTPRFGTSPLCCYGYTPDTPPSPCYGYTLRSDTPLPLLPWLPPLCCHGYAPESVEGRDHLRSQPRPVPGGCHAPCHHHQARVGIGLNRRLKIARDDAIIRHHLERWEGHGEVKGA